MFLPLDVPKMLPKPSSFINKHLSPEITTGVCLISMGILDGEELNETRLIQDSTKD